MSSRNVQEMIAVVAIKFYTNIMSDEWDIFWIFLLICVVAAVLFAGVVKAVKHGFGKSSQSVTIPQHEEMRKAQRERMEDIQRQQKDYMRDHKQKMRDAQRR